MFQINLLVVGNSTLADESTKRIDILYALGTVDIELFHVTTAREAVRVLSGDHHFMMVFLDSGKLSRLGEIRATGYHGPVAVIGEHELAEKDEEFFDATHHDTVNQAICLLVRALRSNTSCPVGDSDRADTDGIPVTVSRDVIQALPIALAQA